MNSSNNHTTPFETVTLVFVNTDGSCRDQVVVNEAEVAERVARARTHGNIVYVRRTPFPINVVFYGQHTGPFRVRKYSEISDNPMGLAMPGVVEFVVRQAGLTEAKLRQVLDARRLEDSHFFTWDYSVSPVAQFVAVDYPSLYDMFYSTVHFAEHQTCHPRGPHNRRSRSDPLFES